MSLVQEKARNALTKRGADISPTRTVTTKPERRPTAKSVEKPRPAARSASVAVLPAEVQTEVEYASMS